MKDDQKTLLSEVVEIFTDGACSGNPGPGGWGVILRYQNNEKELSGGELNTTNNRMELMAAIQGLKALKRVCVVKVYTDSEYVQKGISLWIKKWRKNGWKNVDNKPIKNVELWHELDALAQTQEIEWHWIRGHSGHPENERADLLARTAITDILSKNR